MRKLYEKIIEVFPEISNRAYIFGDCIEDSISEPYVMMDMIADWLKSDDVNCQDKSVIKRVVAFKEWCMEEEPGESAEDDLWTMYTVALFEHLFESPKTRCLIPYLASRAELIADREYLVRWVDQVNYDAVLNLRWPDQGAESDQ